MAVTSKSSVYRYVRRVKRKWQARVPVNGRHLNLGLYQYEFDAWIAAKRFINRGEIPPHLLPQYVRRLPGGGFAARVKVCGRQFFVGPFAGAQEAHDALVRRLKRAFPAGIPLQAPRCWRKGPMFGRAIPTVA